MTDYYRQKPSTFFAIVVMLCMLFLTFLVMVGTVSSTAMSSGVSKIGFEYNWISDDAGNGNLNAFKGSRTFRTQVTADDANGRSLCFYSNNVYFDVTVDGRTVYSFRPDTHPIFGKFYGSMPHQIDLGTVTEASEITITADAINNSTGKFTGVALENGTEFVTEVFKASLFPYCISIVISVMGLLLVLGGLSVTKSNPAGKEITAMGLFAVDAGIWTASSTDLSGVVIGAPVVMHFVNYTSLIVLPGFAVMFVFLLTGRRYKPYANALVLLSAGTLLLNMILTATGVSTYHDLLYLTHAECVATVVYSFACIVRTTKKGRLKDHGTRLTVTLSFLAVALGGLIDLIRYIVSKDSFDAAYFFRLGMMVFVFILSLHEIYALLTYRKYESEAVKMSNLAYTDALTGLKNRMAFTDQEDIFRTRVSGDCIIVQFDINNLKKVNDNYGHKEGDKHIKAAADIINDSFGDIGNCYRTGGDEFILVVDEVKDKSVFEEAKKTFNRLIDEYNRTQKPRVKLEIAYGVQEFDLSSEDVEGALRLADGKMYVMKKQMKGA